MRIQVIPEPHQTDPKDEAKNVKILEKDRVAVHYWEYCDNCGHRLEPFRCRLVCPKCGFYHSCSEP
jgi:hypothetical protein